jgi:hypothetical protein
VIVKYLHIVPSYQQADDEFRAQFQTVLFMFTNANVAPWLFTVVVMDLLFE